MLADPADPLARRLPRMLGMLVLLASVSAGCSAGSGSPVSSASVTVPSATASSAADASAADVAAARRTVTEFYAAIGRGDAESAVALLAPADAGAAGQDRSGWVRSVVELDHLAVGTPRAAAADVIQQHPGQTLLLVVPVGYVATFRSPSANDANGPADRFVLVGRRSGAEPWKILDIATSP